MNVTLRWITPDAERQIVDIARVSSDPSKVKAPDAQLLGYLIRNKHWSPFEMASACVEIEGASRAVTRQIFRHRSFHFQEFCIAGDSEITLELPNGTRRGKRSAYRRTIAHLYSLQERGLKLPSGVRVFDEAKGTFVTAPIREVFKTGIKPVFRVTLENGRQIRTTKEHKFLTAEGFKTLEDALGLSLAGQTAIWTNRDAAFACNGVAVGNSREWLEKAKEKAIADGTGLQGIAQAAGVSTHAVRKWLKAHSLQFTKKEVASYTPIWNKGRKWTRARHSLETIEKIRGSARRGPESNLWRGGVDRPFRRQVADWCNAHRAELLLLASHTCAKCGGHGRLELHHVEPVYKRPDLAMVKDNIEVLCRSCHREHHNTAGHAKEWRQKGRGNTLTIHWSKVRSVEYIGEEMTYDMEVGHVSHNYVANGIVTHNSQRYQDAALAGDLLTSEARLQHPTNRQASVPCADDDLAGWWQSAQERIATTADDLYRQALDRGIAKEVARAILPEGTTPTRMMMSGTIRDWLHYCALRRGNGTQPEHQQIADAIWQILSAEIPTIAEAWEADRINGKAAA